MLSGYFWRVIKLSFTIVVLVVFWRAFVLEPGRVDGISMEPNFIDSELFLVNKFSPLFHEFIRGQVVQIYEPDTGYLIIKRVVALPGEQVTIKQNKVFVAGLDGKTMLVEEKYLPENLATFSKTGQAETYPKLGENEYFVLGDNRPYSSDSRFFGAVKRENIFGIVIALNNR
jgi:signal peptidase I